MYNRRSDARRRSSLIARRVSESAAKSAVKKPTGGAAGGSHGAGGATGSTSKSRLPRPSAIGSTQRPAARSLAAGLGVASGGGRLSSVTPQPTRQMSALRAGPSTASKLSVGRTSMDPSRRQSRGSGIGAARGRCPDPRPVTDKQYLQASTQRVVSFLNERQWRGRPFDRAPITSKELSKCTGREFDAIFNFIYGFFDQSLDLHKKKRELVVPQAMKMLGYPGQLSKSHLLTIGCAHSWPHVLAALSWLVETVEVMFGADPLLSVIPTVEVNGFPSPDGQFRVVLNHSIKSYQRFMSGADMTPEQGAAELKAELAALDGDLPSPQQMERIEAENQYLQSTLEKAVSTNDELRSQLTEITNELKALELDQRRVDDYSASLQDKCGQNELSVDAGARQLTERQRELQLLEQYGAQLRQKIESQELSADDISKIAHQTAAVHKQVEERRSEIRETEDQNGELEMQLHRREAQVETQLRQLNSQLVQLPATLADSEELKPRLRAPQSQHVAQLTQLLRGWEKAERHLRCDLERGSSTLLHLEGTLRETRGTLETSQQEVARMEAKLRRLEEEDAGDRAQNQQQHTALDGQLAEVDAHISQVTAEINQMTEVNYKSKLRLDSKHKLYTGLKEKMEKQHADKLRDVHEMTALTLGLKQHLERERDRVVKGVAQIRRDTMAEIERRVSGTRAAAAASSTGIGNQP